MRSQFENPEQRSMPSELSPHELARWTEARVEDLLPDTLDASSRPLITRLLRTAALVAESRQASLGSATIEGVLAIAAETAGFDGIVPPVSFEDGGVDSALALAQEGSEVARLQSALLAHIKDKEGLDKAFSLLCVGD